MNVGQLTLLLFFQLFFVFGQSGTTPTSSIPVDDDTKFVLDLVRGGVPVGIIQLFLPSDSKDAAGPCLREKLDDDIVGMCKFVKAFAEDYASNPTNDWNSCSKEDYVCNAIYRAATSNNTQNFSCSLWQQKSIQNTVNEKKYLNDKLGLTDKLKSSQSKGVYPFFKMVSSTVCSKTCPDKWRPVCSVSALLLDLLPKVPPNCPKTNMPCNCSEPSNTENQTCQVFKNGTVSSLSVGPIDIKLPEKLVTKEVTVSVSQLLDGGKGRVSTMSIMEKMVTVSTSTANVSMSGSVVVVKLPDNKMSVKLVRKGVPVSVNVALDGGNVSMTASKMNGSVSIMEKTVTMSTSTSDVSTSGNEMFIFKDKTKTVLSVNRQWVRVYTKGTNTTIFPNRNEMTIQKKGMFVSASISSSTIEVFTNKTNVTMSTKGLNLAVLTDTLPMAFSINKADLTIYKESTDVNWMCNISQANQSEKANTQIGKATPTASQSKKAITQKGEATPTASQSKKANTQKSEASTKLPKDVSTISLSSYIIYIAIAGVILVIVGYIAYHNRDYLCKLIGNGGQRGRPKRKNYKHLKSLKDAFP